MTTAQAIYKQNHSDLRAFGRFEKSRAGRDRKVLEACKSRAFWFGDKYTKPASLPAQAALRVVSNSLSLQGVDMLASWAAVLNDIPAQYRAEMVKVKARTMCRRPR